MLTDSRQSKTKALLLLAPVLIALLLLGPGCQKIEDSDQQKKAATAHKNGQVALIMPANAAYTGAYVDFGEGESNVTFDAITGFEKITGRHLAVIAMGNFWGDQAFPAKTVRIIAGYGAVPLIFWSPWDKPYKEGSKPDRFNLPDILAGKWDAYIDQWADAARDYGKPLLVTWGLEMNGTWFPWSGFYYGGGKVVGKKDGRLLYAGPELVKKTYRYVVDRVRARKADNILWGFHANNFGSPQESWNKMVNYYPGTNYVDWLGLSVYGKMLKRDGWPSFDNVMEGPYKEICQLDPQKPIVLAEWGVGEFPPDDKAAFITEVFTNLPSKYQRIRVAVYWHERWENKDGSYSNLRVNSSPEALKAYQTGIAGPYWIDRPLFAPLAGAR